MLLFILYYTSVVYVPVFVHMYGWICMQYVALRSVQLLHFAVLMVVLMIYATHTSTTKMHHVFTHE